MALAMVTFGVSQAAQAIKTAGANKKLANSTTVCDPKCFIAGTLVVCRNENGEECRKPIEEIEVGGNCTLEKMYPHKNASKSAPPRFCDIYMCLYVRNYTQ